MVVLILILLEYGLRQDDDLVIDSFNESLNPYSTGIWSATLFGILIVTKSICLNPYSTGIWSATK